MEQHKADGKVVAFIIAAVINGVNRYRPSIGKCFDSEGDNDSFVTIESQQRYMKDLGEAQAALLVPPLPVDEKFREPVFFDEFGDNILWYSQIEAAQTVSKT